MVKLMGVTILTDVTSDDLIFNSLFRFQIHFSSSTKHLINDKLPKQLQYTKLLSLIILHIS